MASMACKQMACAVSAENLCGDYSRWRRWRLEAAAPRHHRAAHEPSLTLTLDTIVRSHDIAKLHTPHKPSPTLNKQRPQHREITELHTKQYMNGGGAALCGEITELHTKQYKSQPPDIIR